MIFYLFDDPNSKFFNETDVNFFRHGDARMSSIISGNQDESPIVIQMYQFSVLHGSWWSKKDESKKYNKFLLNCLKNFFRLRYLNFSAALCAQAQADEAESSAVFDEQHAKFTAHMLENQEIFLWYLCMFEPW